MGVAALLLIPIARLKPRETLQTGLPGIAGPPIPGGIDMSIEQASKTYEYPLFRPSHALANDDAIEHLWVNSGDDSQVYIEYDTNVVVSIRGNRHISFRKYRELQALDGMPISLTDVRGVAALVVPPDGPASAGSVQILIDGALITVIGNGKYSLDQLEALGASIVDRAAGIRAEGGTRRIAR